jgi:hypothetical protein
MKPVPGATDAVADAAVATTASKPTALRSARAEGAEADHTACTAALVSFSFRYLASRGLYGAAATPAAHATRTRTHTHALRVTQRTQLSALA